VSSARKPGDTQRIDEAMVESENDTAATDRSLPEDLTVLAAAPLPRQWAALAEAPAIALDLSSALASDDGPGTLTVTVLGVPAGATLSAGTDHGGGRWTLDGGELDGLTVTPPLGAAEDFSLTVSATASEGGGDMIAATAHLGVTVTGGPAPFGGNAWADILHVEAGDGSAIGASWTGNFTSDGGELSFEGIEKAGGRE